MLFRYLCSLGRLFNLKYIENSHDTSSPPPAAAPLFPTVENMTLVEIPQVKGWSTHMCIASSSTQKEEDSRQRQRLLKYYSAFSKSKKLAFFKVESEAKGGLSNLERPEITNCLNLRGKCQEPAGQDEDLISLSKLKGFQFCNVGLKANARLFQGLLLLEKLRIISCNELMKYQEGLTPPHPSKSLLLMVVLS
ncbi:hypothetical protein Cgig2_028354 [Carnegiea gigantea]|uniref:Uncharacterized protein n=1 Tax=Carnegiea gigantea TaxID=171969 RepID=A0A9Q1K2D2_9CARY|nr:hypothetical protein Cgig2_028354 [Carnegiea gigantea]